jgi:hypothetical protein
VTRRNSWKAIKAAANSLPGPPYLNGPTKAGFDLKTTFDRSVEIGRHVAFHGAQIKRSLLVVKIEAFFELDNVGYRPAEERTHGSNNYRWLSVWRNSL